MNSTKYQIFISSTYSDLEEERDSIIKAILELYHIPIGMEMFSAEDEDQWEIIRRTIEVSDYYILVLGLRYGSKTSEGISFTQKEYEYALERKIPILAFVMDETVALPKDKRDDDLTEINNFRASVLKNSKMAQFWNTKDELIKNVSISLTKQIMQKPGVGWVRGDKLGNEEALSKELTSLSKENRQLRERVSELESRVSQKTPDIVLSIEHPKIDDNFNAYEILTIPDEIDFGDIEEHLKPYISEDEIEDYNKRIQCQAEVDEYNRKSEIAHKISNYSIPLVIDVSNVGSLKANNVFIDITFPNELLVYDEDEKFEEPNNPLPYSPILIAQNKYEEEQKAKLATGTSELLKSLGLAGNLNAYHDFSGLRGADIHIPKVPYVNKGWSTSLRENELTIRIADLLHTRRRTFDDEYRIAPLKSGKYQIKISVICEEYDSCQEQLIEIEI